MIRLLTIGIGLLVFAWGSSYLLRDPAFSDYQREQADWRSRCAGYLNNPSAEGSEPSRACARELQALTLKAERKGWR